MVLLGDPSGYCPRCTEDNVWYTGTRPEVEEPEVDLQRATAFLAFTFSFY